MQAGLVQRNPATVGKCWVTLSLTQPSVGFIGLLSIRNGNRQQYILRF